MKSKEGTTQGDPPSMAFYAMGLMPLIWCLLTQNSYDQTNNASLQAAKHVAYANELTDRC